MTPNIVEAGPFERVVTVLIEDSVIESAKDEAAKRLAQDLKLKGFRPGRIPFSVLRQRYGPQAKQEVIQQTAQTSLQQAIEHGGKAVPRHLYLDQPAQPRDPPGQCTVFRLRQNRRVVPKNFITLYLRSYELSSSSGSAPSAIQLASGFSP